MASSHLNDLVEMRRTRDFIDRNFAAPLDIAELARRAGMSPAHFSRTFRKTYGESPYSYLLTRRIERAKTLLRQGRQVTETCYAVGWESLGSFSARFSEIVGESPLAYRGRDHESFRSVPACVAKQSTRPQRSPASVTGG